jgi:hypothetical protein
MRNAPDGARVTDFGALGMSRQPQFRDAPITNIRNTASPHWRGWLKPDPLRGVPVRLIPQILEVFSAVLFECPCSIMEIN